MTSTSRPHEKDRSRPYSSEGTNVVKFLATFSLVWIGWSYRHVLWTAVFDSGVRLISTSRDPSFVTSGVRRARERLESREQCDSLFKPGPDAATENQSAVEFLLSVHLRNANGELQQESLLLIEKVLEVDGATRLRNVGAERALSEAARDNLGTEQQAKAHALVAALKAAAE